MRFPNYLRAHRSDAEIEASLAIARRILAADGPDAGEPMLEYYRSCLDVLDQKTVALLTVTSIAIAISTVALTQPAFQPHFLDQTVRWIAIVSMVFEVVTMVLLLLAAWAYWVEEDPKGVPAGDEGVRTVVMRLVRARAQRTALYYRSWFTSYVFLACVLAIAVVSVWVRLSDVPHNQKLSERVALVSGPGRGRMASREPIDATAYCRASLDVTGAGGVAPVVRIEGTAGAPESGPWVGESTGKAAGSSGTWHYDAALDHPWLRLKVQGRPGADLRNVELLLTLIPCGGGD
jgi:hypothetical protein